LQVELVERGGPRIKSAFLHEVVKKSDCSEGEGKFERPQRAEVTTKNWGRKRSPPGKPALLNIGAREKPGHLPQEEKTEK